MRELKERNRLLEQENEVLRRANINLRRASCWVPSVGLPAGFPLGGRGISLSQGVCAIILWTS